MAFGADDIKTLDQHIVSPLIERMDALGARLDGRIDGLADVLEGVGTRIVASNERTQDSITRWLASERHRLLDVERRLLELERWRASLEKKNEEH